MFASRLLGTGVTKTHALESPVIAGYVRGLSTRDVEATLAEALGDNATVSRSTVSRICAELKAEMAAWQQRRLDEIELDTPAGLRRLQDLRRELLEPPTPLRHAGAPAADEPDPVGVVA